MQLRHHGIQTLLIVLAALAVGLAMGSAGRGGEHHVTAPRVEQVALSTPTAHLVVVVMENKDYNQVVGSSSAPYLNQTLVPSGTSWTKFFAAVKPSLPNYLVMTSGSFQDCVTDTCPVRSIPGDNLFSKLEDAGLSWRVYAEDMPSNCYGSNLKAYAVRHNPAVYYQELGPEGSNSCAINDVPLTRLTTDLAQGTLPDFAIVVPNKYNDMHTDLPSSSCPGSGIPKRVCQGDRFLQQWVPQILSNGGQDDVTLVVTFDEGDKAVGGGGQIPTVVVGPTTCAGCKVTRPVTEYGLANAFVDWFGLPPYDAPMVSLTGS